MFTTLMLLNKKTKMFCLLIGKWFYKKHSLSVSPLKLIAEITKKVFKMMHLTINMTVWHEFHLTFKISHTKNA